jgi:co-chaperonin GroES (HSP10)
MENTQINPTSFKGITPLKDFLIVEVVPKTTSGIILPGNSDNPKAELSDVYVLAIGNEVTNVKVGDKILTRPGIPFINIASFKHPKEGGKYGLIDAFSIIAIEEVKSKEKV